MNEGHPLSILIVSLEDLLPACLRQVLRRDQVHGGLDGVVLPPELDHSVAQGPVAQPCAWHDVPAQDLRDQIGGHFTVGESAVGKIPQRAFACYRLVDDRYVADAAQKCSV
ncbi:hypothetical protein D3C73_1334050 [compost metagenome]